MAGIKKRKIGTIWKNLRTYCNEENPDSVKQNDKFSKYRGGGMNNQDAHIVDMDRYKPFKTDGVAVKPHKVPNDANVGQVFTALVIEYEDSGWDVIQ